MAVINVGAESSTLVLNGKAITDMVSGDIITLTPANPSTVQINSTNGGVNINQRSDRQVYDLTMRVQRQSGSDVFLNNSLRQAPAVVFNGSLKEGYSRDGVDGVESWILEGGSITSQPTKTVNNEDGNALSEYTIRFRSATRNI